MSETTAKTDTDQTSEPPKIGIAWGDDISEERQRELDAILAAWEAETDHGERKGPFDSLSLSNRMRSRLALTGADVFYLAADTLIETTSSGNNGLIADIASAYAALRNPNLKNSLNLSALNLAGAGLGEAELEQANLWGAQLQHAYLSRAQLARAAFVEAHLEGAFLEEAQMQEGDLREAHLEKAESTIRPAAPGGRRDPADGRGPGPHPDTGRCAESADLQSGVGGLPRARSHPDQHQGEFDLPCLRSLVGLGPLGPALHGAGGLPGAGPRGQRHTALRRARDRRPRADGRGDGAAHRARGMNSGSDLGKDAPYPSGLLGADRLSPIPRVRWQPNPHA
jgi:hypothetical protein